MSIEFQKPQEFLIPKGELLAELCVDLYQVKQFGIELSIPITIARISKDFNNGEIAQLSLGDLNKEELHKSYYDIKMLIFHCAWLAEVLFERLKGINNSEFIKSPKLETIEKFLSGKGKPYEKLDFIAHKDLLCAILKNLEKSKSLPFDRKNFCTLFDDIIVQRNNFTHGKLLLLQTEVGYQTILNSDKGYHILDKSVLNSYNECYFELTKVLHQSSQLLKD
jgi:hypothetical protein